MTTIKFKIPVKTKTDAEELTEYCIANNIPHRIRTNNNGTITHFEVESSRRDMVDKKTVTTQLDLTTIKTMIKNKGLTET